MLPSFVITTKRNETILGYCDFGKSQRSNFDISNFVVSTETGISFEDIFGSYENSHIGFFGKIFNKKRLQKIYEIITNKSLYDQSDLNIFLELYKELGIESFKYIEGPFAAFVIGKNNFKVFSSLNPTYPLYYYNSDGVFWLANEVKVFRVNPRVDLSLKDFDTKNNDIEQPANYTLFNKVQKISARAFLEFQNNGNEITINGKDYFKDARAEENASKKETINKLDHLFKQSIEDYIFLNNARVTHFYF